MQINSGVDSKKLIWILTVNIVNYQLLGNYIGTPTKYVNNWFFVFFIF